MNRSVTSAADALGLDPKIGGHDRLVVLCLLAHANAETGEAATAGALAGVAEMGPEELVEGPLAGLLGAGYAEVGVVQTVLDLSTDVGQRTFAGAVPTVGLTQRTGYRITKEGLDAVAGHLSALRALPGSLKAHLLDKSSGAALPEEGPEAREKGR